MYIHYIGGYNHTILCILCTGLPAVRVNEKASGPVCSSSVCVWGGVLVHDVCVCMYVCVCMCVGI
jgi:hypothetical protein